MATSCSCENVANPNGIAPAHHPLIMIQTANETNQSPFFFFVSQGGVAHPTLDSLHNEAGLVMI